MPTAPQGSITVPGTGVPGTGVPGTPWGQLIMLMAASAITDAPLIGVLSDRAWCISNLRR